MKKGQTGLKPWAVGALLITTLMIGLTGIISDGLSVYQVNQNVDTQQLEEIQDVSQATGIADTAQQRAEEAQAKSNFFTLPKVVKLLRLPFDAIPIWEKFVGTSMNILGLQYATSNWPLALFSGFIGLSIAFAFGRRVL